VRAVAALRAAVAVGCSPVPMCACPRVPPYACACLSISPISRRLEQLLRRELREALQLARVVDQARGELSTHVRVVEGNVLRCAARCAVRGAWRGARRVAWCAARRAAWCAAWCVARWALADGHRRLRGAWRRVIEDSVRHGGWSPAAQG